MPPRKVPDDATLVAMYERPMSPREMADELGLSKNTVAAALARIPGFKKRSVSEAQKLTFQQGRKPLNWWKGKKQPRAMVEKRVSKIRGEKHYLWKGGKSIRPYRQKIPKERCAICGATTNLCIHHIDFDHYNNAEDNLVAICVSCHLSLHKRAYWDAVKDGREPPRSTGEAHWKPNDWRRWRAKNRERYNEAQRTWNERRRGGGE